MSAVDDWARLVGDEFPAALFAHPQRGRKPEGAAANRSYAAPRALLCAGKHDEAVVRLCAMRPGDLVAKELLFDAFFQRRHYPPAFALIQELADGQPDNAVCSGN